MSSAPASAADPSPRRANYAVSISILGGLFFIFGFFTWLNGALIPFLKLACELTTRQALLVTSAFYISYFCLALPASAILRKTGFRRGMSLGLVTMAAGALVFIPAALVRSYPLFLTGLFVQGMGLALLQTAANPFVTVLGPIESAASRISIMGICNKSAGIVGPLILAAILLGDANEIDAKIKAATETAVRLGLLEELAQRVITPYIVLAAVLVVVAVLIAYSPLPKVDESHRSGDDVAAPSEKTSIFQFPHLLLGAFCIFVYVGVEVMAGDVIPLYGQALGLTLDQTKNLTIYTMGSMLVGYTIGIFTIPRMMRQQTALMGSAIIGIVFSAAAYATTGYISITFIALLGLANALMWPAIFPLAIDGLGRFTKIGSALLIMGIAGGAIIPQAYGHLAEVINHQAAFFWCVLPGYLYILYYGAKGHRVGRG